MSESAIKSLGNIGETVKIYTYMRVREDDVSLYGFVTNEELRMFELLLSVSGIGAKSALVILSNVTPSKFALAVIANDVNVLKKQNSRRNCSRAIKKRRARSTKR